MHDVAAFVARVELLPGMQPTDGALNDPPVAAQSLVGLNAPSRNPWCDSSFSQFGAVRLGGIPFIRM